MRRSNWIKRAVLWPWQRRERRRRREDAANLMNFARRTYSQNGEDGIIAEILERIGPVPNHFVEFGVGLGKTQPECNTYRLLAEEGWSGTWIEGCDDFGERAAPFLEGRPLRLLHRFIDAENIVELFREAEVPAEPGIVSIDIDGNDWHVWKSLGAHYRPSLFVVEYNGSHKPEVSWVMPYNPSHVWNETCYYGASLRACAELGQELGYALVGCDPRGVNAFLVREDLLQDRFLRPGDVEYHYVAPDFGRGLFGHPRKPPNPNSRREKRKRAKDQQRREAVS